MRVRFAGSLCAVRSPPAHGRASVARPVWARSAQTAAAPGGTCLKKIPQPSEFNDLLSRQNSGDQFTLRGGVNLIQMPLRYRFGHKLPYALVEGALSKDVGH